MTSPFAGDDLAVRLERVLKDHHSVRGLPFDSGIRTATATNLDDGFGDERKGVTHDKYQEVFRLDDSLCARE